MQGTGLGSSHVLTHDVCLLVSVICGHARHCLGSSHVLIHDVSCVTLCMTIIYRLILIFGLSEPLHGKHPIGWL